MDSVCPPLIVRHVSFDRVIKVPFTLIQAILSCHLKWMHVIRPQNRTSQQSNWHQLWTKFSKNPIQLTHFSQVFNRCSTEINSWERKIGTDRKFKRKTNGSWNFTKTDWTNCCTLHFSQSCNSSCTRKYVPAKASFIISGGSIVLSFFLFILNFPLFHRQARALCWSPRRFFKKKSDQQFIHVMDDIGPDSDTSFLNINREEFPALRALAKEALLKTEANAPFIYSTEDEEKLYLDVTAQTRTIRTTPPLVLTTFTPTSVSHVDTTQTTSA